MGRIGSCIGLLLAFVLMGGCTVDEAMYVQTGSVDGIPLAVTGINWAHYEVHEGVSYSVADTVVADTTTVKWQITTPDSTTYAHLVFTLTCTGEATFLVTEGSDRNDGAPLDVVNRRRVGTPAVSSVVVSRTPVGGSTDGATILFNMRKGITGQGAKNIEGGYTRELTEWILKPDTKYVVSITTYADVHASCQFDWYESAK